LFAFTENEKMPTIKHQKAQALYATFERKAEGAEVSHYCPGCGHGVVHNLIAEAIDDLGIQDRVIFCSPVGCSVFAYYYFDVGNIQCAHGRAPAVASAIRRTNDEAIVISYQGDGDLAGIGMSQIVHAANRGENITVIFINNAIYGMTGGQMAPTTILKQKTITTPGGRNAANEGFPIGMAELINSLQAPVFVERVSLATAPKVMKARMAIRKALRNQVDKKGFSLVEVLSPCPVNWKMTPVEARRWIEENLEPVFPIGNLRDLPKGPFDRVDRKKSSRLSDKKILEILGVGEEEAHTRTIHLKEEQHVKIAGFGGQGVLSTGILLANCAIAEGLKTTWLPSYGAEMRGGTANASINISHDTIGSPIVSFPNTLMAMNLPSLDAFEDTVRPGGHIYVNSSLVPRKVRRTDVTAYHIPATDMANSIGASQIANVILLTVYALVSGAITLETLQKVIPLSIKRKNLVNINMQAIEAGISWHRENCRE
jgi:2-oxoisovalerate ferredoxin oxidoreductase beta subunit